MSRCPTCGERAQHRVFPGECAKFPPGPKIRVCHAPEGAFVHVAPEDTDA